MNKLFRINHLRFVAVFAAAVLITSSCKEKIKLNLEKVTGSAPYVMALVVVLLVTTSTSICIQATMLKQTLLLVTTVEDR